MRVERIYGCDGFESEVAAELRGDTLLLSVGGRNVSYSISRLPGGGFLLHDGHAMRLAYAARRGSLVWVQVDGRTHRYELCRRSRGRGAGADGGVAGGAAKGHG
ncbi:MAG: hypothetical protein QUU85_02210, partial [Candidatus Eisenbacteria bacterium]|nr:hypothetical protein [Candidatus Eisenbacteria bacterium]